MTSEELVKQIVKVLDEKKGENIMAIKTADKTVIADYFIVVNGSSNTHVKALADEVEYEMGKKQIEPLHIEGKATGWILLDYNEVLVHVFTKEQRDFYNLERLWVDAELMDLSDVLTED